jgi:hypothetical protein
MMEHSPAERLKRTTPPLFPDTFDGLLAKAKMLTRECPHRDEWRCVMGFVEYKLAPDAAHVREDVIDALIAWIGECREQVEATGRCDEAFVPDDITAEELARLIRLVAARLEEIDA